MVCKCCASNCKTGYASVQEEELERKLLIIKFPDGKKEAKKKSAVDREDSTRLLEP